MTTTATVGRRFATLVPGMYPSAPKRNFIVASLYLYGTGVAMAVFTLVG